jgi:hypothetical protein
MPANGAGQNANQQKRHHHRPISTPGVQTSGQHPNRRKDMISLLVCVSGYRRKKPEDWLDKINVGTVKV